MAETVCTGILVLGAVFSLLVYLLIYAGVMVGLLWVMWVLAKGLVSGGSDGHS